MDTLPQTLDEFMPVVFTIQFTVLEDPNNGYHQEGLYRSQEHGYRLKVNAGMGGPNYCLYLGSPDNQRFGNQVNFQVSVKGANQTYTITRIYGKSQWAFKENTPLKGLPQTRECPDELNDLINNTFRLYYKVNRGMSEAEYPEHLRPAPKMVIKAPKEPAPERERAEDVEPEKPKDEGSPPNLEMGWEVVEERMDNAEKRFAEVKEVEAKIKSDAERKQEQADREWFIQIVVDRELKRVGRFKDQIDKITEGEMLIVHKMIQTHGQQTVASWWEQWKKEKGAENIDF